MLNGSQYYTFTRYFWVDIPIGSFLAGTLTMTVAYDDGIQDMMMNGNVLAGSGTSCIPGQVTLTLPVLLQPGLNNLDIRVNNRSLNSSNSSSMAIRVQGTISTSANVIIDNHHFMPNSGGFTSNPFIPSCQANPLEYIVSPTFNTNCIPPGDTAGLIFITNYNTNFTYTLLPNNQVLNDSFFVAKKDSTYIVVVSDQWGCSDSQSVSVEEGFAIDIYPPVSWCLNDTLSTAYFSFQPMPGGPYLYAINGGGFQTNNVFSNLSEGQYTLSAKDFGGCIVSEERHVNLIHMNPSANPQAFCVGQDSVALQANVYYSPWLTFSSAIWTPGANLNDTLVKVSPLTSTTYSLDVLFNDIYSKKVGSINPVLDTSTCGYHDTVSVVVYTDLPKIDSFTQSQLPCNPLIEAHASQGLPPYTWQWLAGYSISNQTPTPSLPGQPNVVQPPLQIPWLNYYNYTAQVTDAHGCTATNVTQFSQNPFCCGSSNTNQLFAQNNAHCFSSSAQWIGKSFVPGMIPVAQANSAQLVSQFGSTVITTNDNIIFDGVTLINQDITFVNCPNIYFTPHSQMNINSTGKILSFINCHITTTCDQYTWVGIIGNNSSQMLRVENCHISYMESGLTMFNACKINAVDNTFFNNVIGINLRNANTNGYTASTGACLIKGNTFESDSSLMITYVFYPDSIFNVMHYRGEHGVLITNCKSAQVGTLNDCTTERNFFKNLFNGINISTSDTSAYKRYFLYNNFFKNINQWTAPPYNSTVEQAIMNTWNSPFATSHRGAAIRARVTNTYPNAGYAILEVKYSCDLLDIFYNCDKGITTDDFSIVAEHANMKNCLIGIKANRANNRGFDIRNCALNGGVEAFT
ncbi:MAG: hypothetical protein R2831_04535 [Chitinophagaceae bacterium]